MNFNLLMYRASRTNLQLRKAVCKTADDGNFFGIVLISKIWYAVDSIMRNNLLQEL